MKPVDVWDNSFAEYNEESNKKKSKFKVGNHVRILKFKNVLAKGYTPDWREEFFLLKRKKEGHLKYKVDSKRLFETGIAEIISATLFNSIILSIASLRSVNNTEINDFIKNTLLNKIADVVSSIIISS